MVYTIRFSRYKRRRRDLNPRAAINDLLPFQGSPFSLLGTSPYKLKHSTNYGRAFKLPDGNGRSLRRGWDSNPCAREGKRFSRPPRYDHFDTSPDIFIAAKAQLYADPVLVSAFSILTKSDWLVNDFLIKKQCYLNILRFPILCKHGIIYDTTIGELIK